VLLLILIKILNFAKSNDFAKGRNKITKILEKLFEVRSRIAIY
jgi:hypothetical protein